VSAQAWFAQQEVAVTPGVSGEIRLTVANLGDSTESFSLVPSGLAAGWTVVRPANVTLFGGSQELVSVEIKPPPLPSTTAGPTALTIRVIPQSDPDDVVSTETTLNVATINDRRMTLLQPALRSRRKAVYELMFDNQSNIQASCRMRLSEGMARVDADFDPPAVGVEPGAATLVKMKMRTRDLQWDRRSRTIPFVVEAEQPGAPSAFVAGTLVQAPMIPERLFGRLAGAALAAAGLAAAWFGVVRPEIRNTAKSEVEAAVVTIPAPSTTVAPGGSLPEVVDPTEGGVTPSLPGVAQLLQPGTGSGETTSVPYTAPADSDFLLTDWLLQNPGGDAGTAVLLRGAEVLARWDLATVQVDRAQAYVTPIEVPAGTELSFQINCVGTADQSGACSSSLLVSGKLRPTG
jgi:hypothetical protein